MKKLFTLAIMALTLVLMTSSTLSAQRTISGVVSDDTGESLIGANILEKGTANGTITDLDGSFSLSVADGATLVFSFTGFTEQEIALGASDVINVTLAAGELLDEVVVTGYGTQSKKEVTSSVVKLGKEDFNQGAISDPAQLLQGKVAGLQIYNRGGNPNASSTIRLRGISTVGANSEPLIVIDGIIGASLSNVDPNDIEDVNVLKDGSAAAIYGSRGSSGVIIITTKKGKADGTIDVSYSGQVSTSQAVNGVQLLTGEEFVAAGGTDLGSSTDWIGEVTRPGFTHIHNAAVSGGMGNTNFRISTNIRDVDGILDNSGFDQFNTRLNLSTRILNDKLKIDFSSSFTDKNQQNGFLEALRYGIVYNPSAPVLGDDAPFQFNSEQFGGFFETLGLFDSFNPASIIRQNKNNGKRKEFNYGANLKYSITDNLSANFRVAEQNNSYGNIEYYPTTSLFRGNATSPTRKGLARFYNENRDFKLYEAFGTYLKSTGNIDFTVTGGYSFQQIDNADHFFELGDFPNNDLNFGNLIETSQDLNTAGFIGANSNQNPDEKIIAFFGRVNLTFDNAIFVNASLRREGSTKLGPDNQWGTFPAFGVGVDLNKYIGLNNVDQFKIRLGYGVTGALPLDNGLSQEIRSINNDASGGVTTSLQRAANRDLKWEEKRETNLGVEFASNAFSATLDLYKRDIDDFILERTVDPAEFGVNRRIENAGKLSTKGIELALNYDVIANTDFSYTTGIVLSSYKTTLDEFVIDRQTRANLGSPGQNGTNMILVEVGQEIGTIWGPVFSSVSAEGTPVFEDINGDGDLITAQDKGLDENADFAILGNGIPDIELGWTNRISVGDWNINAFFRGAFGHSLVNTFRAFYEPRISSQSSYNYVTTSKAEPGLTSAQFSSLYVEKADFFKLDNLTISRSFNLADNDMFKSVSVSIVGQNLIVLTSYTGTDPEPSLIDNGDVLSPGIDRRNNYFASRSFTFGLNLNF